jgi:hypothetical protein
MNLISSITTMSLISHQVAQDPPVDRDDEML